MSRTPVFISKNNILLPLLILLLGKVLGVFFVINSFNASFSVQKFFTEYNSLNIYFSSEEIVLINTFSDIFMYFLLFLVTSLVTFVFLNNKRMHKDKFSIKTLSNPSFINLLKDSTNLYSNLVSWVFVMILSTIWITYNYIGGNSKVFSVLISVIPTIAFSILIILDVFFEIRAIKFNIKRHLNAGG